MDDKHVCTFYIFCTCLFSRIVRSVKVILRVVPGSDFNVVEESSYSKTRPCMYIIVPTFRSSYLFYTGYLIPSLTFYTCTRTVSFTERTINLRAYKQFRNTSFTRESLRSRNTSFILVPETCVLEKCHRNHLTATASRLLAISEFSFTISCRHCHVDYCTSQTTKVHFIHECPKRSLPKSQCDYNIRTINHLTVSPKGCYQRSDVTIIFEQLTTRPYHHRYFRCG